MRRSAYIKALEQAAQLPDSIPELKKYFQDGYNPRLLAIQHIKQVARLDVGALSDGEATDVMKWSEGKRIEELGG